MDLSVICRETNKGNKAAHPARGDGGRTLTHSPILYYVLIVSRFPYYTHIEDTTSFRFGGGGMIHLGWS